MGVKNWLIAYVDGNAAEILKSKPQLDRSASESLAKRLFPSSKLTYEEDGDLSFCMPDRNEIQVGCYPGLSIVAANAFALDYPSKLPQHFLQGGKVYLHAQHSVVDWFAFAIWENGQLLRALSLSSDGLLEDIGQKLKCEEPRWAGEHPIGDDVDDYPFPFHPLELAEAVRLEMFGFQLEGYETDVDPGTIPLMHFAVKPWWKLW